MAGPRPLLLLALFVGCATEDPRGEAPLRTDDPADAQTVDGAPDARPPDAAPPDADARVEVAATKAVFVVVSGQPFAAGVRARLDPPHMAQPSDDLAGRFDAALVRWAGPGDPRTALLDARLAGQPTSVIYDLDAVLAEGAQLSAVDAHVAWLAAHLVTAPRALAHDTRPLVGVRGAGRWPAAFARARAALAERSDAGWLVELADDDAVPSGADILAAMPEVAYGASRSDDRPRATPADAARRRAWADEAAARGVAWYPVAAPPANARLDAPGRVVAPPDDEALLRSLVLARRAAGAVVVVNGLGAWRDDRQLDPVQGPPTAAPVELTTGVEYTGYGSARLDLVERLLRRPAGPPGDLSDPELTVLVDAPTVTFERLEVADGAVWISAARPAAVPIELGLSFDPFVVPDGARLRYELVDVEGYVDLVFASGDRLGAGAGLVDLGPHAGRRVEEVVLVLPPGLARLEGHLTGLAID